MNRALLLGVGLAVAAVTLLVTLSALRAGFYSVAPLAKVAPRRTALMRQRETGARRMGRPYRVDQRWVPYARISPVLRRAVLIAEDDAFYSHGGLDWNEIGASARTNLERRRVVRGGSTVTQQLAKNLFLGDRRTLTRKLTEVLLAFRLERSLSKRRIFELYLNLIEWGDGIYGVEAAAERYFQVPSSQLSERQAVLLAAVIINPRRYSPLQPARRIERRVRMIASRMRRRGYLDQDQYLAVIGGAPLPPAPLPGWRVGAPAESATAPPHGTLAPGGAPDTSATPR